MTWRTAVLYSPKSGHLVGLHGTTQKPPLQCRPIDYSPAHNFTVFQGSLEQFMGCDAVFWLISATDKPSRHISTVITSWLCSPTAWWPTRWHLPLYQSCPNYPEKALCHPHVSNGSVTHSRDNHKHTPTHTFKIGGKQRCFSRRITPPRMKPRAQGEHCDFEGMDGGPVQPLWAPMSHRWTAAMSGTICWWTTRAVLQLCVYRLKANICPRVVSLSDRWWAR